MLFILLLLVMLRSPACHVCVRRRTVASVNRAVNPVARFQSRTHHGSDGEKVTRHAPTSLVVECFMKGKVCAVQRKYTMRGARMSSSAFEKRFTWCDINFAKPQWLCELSCR